MLRPIAFSLSQSLHGLTLDRSALVVLLFRSSRSVIPPLREAHPMLGLP